MEYSFFLSEDTTVWSPLSSAELLLGSPWATSWVESNRGRKGHVLLWAADVLKLPGSKPSDNVFPYLLAADSYLSCSPHPAFPSPSFSHLLDDEQLQAGLPSHWGCSHCARARLPLIFG